MIHKHYYLWVVSLPRNSVFLEHCQSFVSETLVGCTDIKLFLQEIIDINLEWGRLALEGRLQLWLLLGLLWMMYISLWRIWYISLYVRKFVNNTLSNVHLYALLTFTLLYYFLIYIYMYTHTYIATVSFFMCCD